MALLLVQPLSFMQYHKISLSFWTIPLEIHFFKIEQKTLHSSVRKSVPRAAIETDVNTQMAYQQGGLKAAVMGEEVTYKRKKGR